MPFRLTYIALTMFLSACSSLHWGKQPEPYSFSEEVCQSTYGRAGDYPKSVTVLPFEFTAADLLGDLPGFREAYARHLTDRLSASSFFHTQPLIFEANQYSPDLLGEQVKDWEDHARVVAAETGSQIVVMGRVTDVSEGPPKGLLSSLLRTPMRAFRVDMWVVDGFSGGRLGEYHYALQREGNTATQGLPPFSNAFLRTGFGAIVSETVEMQLRDIHKSAACEPVAGHVVAVEDDQVYVDMGHTTGIQVGDPLVAYQRRDMRLRETRTEGYREVPIGIIKVNQVAGHTASGKLEKPLAQLALRPGDVVWLEAHTVGHEKNLQAYPDQRAASNGATPPPES